jgi:hypothetical protein
VDAVTESLKDLTKEEIETVRAKLADLEGRFVETKTDVAMNVEDITPVWRKWAGMKSRF